MAIFNVILHNVKFTRYLQLDLCDSHEGHYRFKQIMDALKEVALRSFTVIGALDAASYVHLARVLNDPVGSINLISQLKTLRLPMRSPGETK